MLSLFGRFWFRSNIERQEMILSTSKVYIQMENPMNSYIWKVLVFPAFLHILHYVENVTDFKTPKEFQFCLLQVPLMVGHNEALFERYKTVMLMGIGLICSENFFAYWKASKRCPLRRKRIMRSFSLLWHFEWCKSQHLPK